MKNQNTTGLTSGNLIKVNKTKQNYKMWSENFNKMCDQYDLNVHEVISPNKMPPDFNESLRNLGLSTN